MSNIQTSFMHCLELFHSSESKVKANLVMAHYILTAGSYCVILGLPFCGLDACARGL